VLRSRVLMTMKRSPAMVLSVLAPVMLLPSLAASSGSSALRYDYEFKGTHGTVINSAPAGPVALLRLYGSWARVWDGVRFRGNTSGDASVAYGRPARGFTMNTPAGQAAGLGTRIVYHAPANGTCFADTPNIAQIGRYSRRGPSGQVKIQLSGCADRRKNVMMQCRFAGSLTAPKAPPLQSTLPLINGDAYNVSCQKSPDRANNITTITLTVTRLNGGPGRKTVTNTFTVRALGRLRTTEYFSVGNKYPLPPPARNTDQFNGDVTRVVYCAGPTHSVRACLAAHLHTP
jgi:hypothetical protein